MKTFISSEILDRLRGALNLSNDTELASHLGIKKATLSNWRSRNSLDWPLLFSFCEHIDINWLVWGNESNAPIENPKQDTPDITAFMPAFKELNDTIREQAEEIGRLKECIRQLTVEKEKHVSSADIDSTANVG